ncbi:hypothetical protein [Blastopirellula marina]|uniref:Uncharacterized protein n=1 Tax=Blastopirellula marina TaxID=124 RepID=A0A2S8GDW3_9BACT|nr:hypothetical protein [Blastopirellula marina]PQO42652.1 hypothetical protein C5Y98_02095 [Blastopirellula marina]PTL46418.1 hypothetical protein C5Y97_02095 [Blastopirellula marina]
MFIRIVVCFVIGLALCSPHARAATDEAITVRKQLAETLGNIKTLSASYDLACKRPEPHLVNERLNSQNRLILESFRWRHNREKGWAYFNGELFGNLDDVLNYPWRVFAWDGVSWTAYHGERHNALIAGSPQPFLGSRITITTFLGDHLIDNDNGLLEVLEKGSDLTVTTLPSGVHQLSCLFNWELDSNPAYWQGTCWHRLTVDIDPAHGGMPRKIVVYDRRCDKPEIVVEITKFTQVDDRYWIPVEGKRTRFHNKFVEDAKLLEKLESASTQAERLQIARQFRFLEPRKMGAGTIYFSAAPETVEVNKDYPQTDFQFSLPDDAGYLDTRTGKSRRRQGT